MPNEHAQLLARDTNGPVIQLLRNLQGPNGIEWLAATNRFLRKENPWPLYEPPEIKLWKSLNLRQYATYKILYSVLRRAQFSLDSTIHAWESGDIEVKPKTSRLKITKISVYDLGFRVGGTFLSILTQARSLGLEPFSTDLHLVAAFVAIASKEKKHGEVLEIPAPDQPYSSSEVFIIGEGKRIKGHRRRQEDFISPETIMVFKCPKISSV